MPRRPDIPAVPAGLVALARSRAGVVSAGEAYAAGITKSQIEALVRVGPWTMLGGGTYLLGAWRGDEGPTVQQRCWSALLRARPGAVVGGAAAWELHGLDGAAAGGPVEIVIPGHRTRRQASDRRFAWYELNPDEVVMIEGLPVVSVRRLLIEASANASREDFVSMLDSALHHERVSVDELAALRNRFAERTQAWVDLADGRSESALETRIRLIAVDAGIPPDDLNLTVRRGKVPVARIDLVWLRNGIKLGLEGDGKKFHSKLEPLYRDRRRQAELTALGWVIVRVTWWDVINRPRWVVDQILRHLYSAA